MEFFLRWRKVYDWRKEVSNASPTKDAFSKIRDFHFYISATPYATDPFASKPEKRLFKVIIRFSRDIIVLQVLFAMKSDGFGLDFTFLECKKSDPNGSSPVLQKPGFKKYLNIDLISAQNNRNIFANSNQITMPVGYILIGNSRCDIKHNDGALPLNTWISKSSYLTWVGKSY